jgi:recombinational DNA repair protein (RecF pathway)
MMNDETVLEREAIQPTDLVIRLNIALTNDPCALCGQPTDPTGIDLYLAEKPALVCNACGLLHAPALVRLLNLASAANMFVRAEYEMSGVQTDEKHP